MSETSQRIRAVRLIGDIGAVLDDLMATTKNWENARSEAIRAILEIIKREAGGA